MFVYPDQKWFKRIQDGWAQFASDLDNYVPRDLPEKPQASAIMQLPSLSIQIKGEVTTSNLPAFKEAAETFVANIKTDLSTDEDFANAEATVKFCSETEKKIELAKNAAIAQTASIDELMRTMDHIKESMRVKRLSLEKIVKTQKETIKNKIITDAKIDYQKHTDALNEEIKPIRWEQENPRFADAIKNKRTLESLHNAVDTELARCKIASNAIAKDIRSKLSWFRENTKGSESLYPDISTIIAHDVEHFTMIVKSRIADQKKKVEEAAAQKIIDDAEAAKKLSETEPVQEDPLPTTNKSQVPKGGSKKAASYAPTKQETAIQEATESIASIIESTSPQCDLSTVIVKAIVEGKIQNVTIQY